MIPDEGRRFSSTQEISVEVVDDQSQVVIVEVDEVEVEEVDEKNDVVEKQVTDGETDAVVVGRVVSMQEYLSQYDIFFLIS